MGHDPSPELLPPDGETAPLSVGQAQRTAAQLFAKDSILLTEIVNQILLAAVQPTGGGCNLFSAIGLQLADLRNPTRCLWRSEKRSRRCSTLRSFSGAITAAAWRYVGLVTQFAAPPPGPCGWRGAPADTTRGLPS